MIFLKIKHKKDMFLTKADLCPFFSVMYIVYLVFLCDSWELVPMKSYYSGYFLI